MANLVSTSEILELLNEKASRCFSGRECIQNKKCTIQEKVLQKIVNTESVVGPSMYALFCMFQSLLTDTGIRNFESGISQIVRLNVLSVQGYVFIVEFLKAVSTIVKIPQTNDFARDLVREYYVCAEAINSLRYEVPTFVYGYGVRYPKNPVTEMTLSTMTKHLPRLTFALYEYIPGKSMMDALQNDGITFEAWLSAYAQILLSLELAQERFSFTHFDLHIGNVMLRDSPVNYSFLLGDKEFEVTSSFAPVIIDFGLASAVINGKQTGLTAVRHAGILPHMVPGVDAYKFAASSMVFTKNPALREQLMGLFRMYGEDDPYNLANETNLGTAASEFFKKSAFSRVGTYTPRFVFNWLYGEFYDVLSRSIRVKHRKRSHTMRVSSSVKTFEELIGHPHKAEERAVELGEMCLSNSSSYIMSAYAAKIFTEYSRAISLTAIDTLSKSIEMRLRAVGDDLISLDRKTLEEVFSVEIPTQELLSQAIDFVLAQPLTHLDEAPLEFPDNLRRVFDWVDKITPYRMMYYTILELGLQKTYQDWVDRFQQSQAYVLFRMNEVGIARARRWIATLDARIKDG